MRWSAVLAGLGLAGGMALADPIAEETLLIYTRDGTAEMRIEAARQLAQRIKVGNARALELAKLAVISNDPKVRGPLLDALIANAVIPRPTAALVPTASVLEKRIRQLRPKDKPEELPFAKECRLTGGTTRAATLECRSSRCGNACTHEVRTFTVTTGVRWTIDETQRRSTEDGSCGVCMLVE